MRLTKKQIELAREYGHLSDREVLVATTQKQLDDILKNVDYGRQTIVIYGGSYSGIGDSATIKYVSGNATIKYVYDNATIESVSGNATIKSVYDSATIESVYDNATIESVSGNATIKYVYGNATIKSVYGNATIESVSGNATIKYVSGNATIKYVYDFCFVRVCSADAKVNIQSDFVSYVETFKHFMFKKDTTVYKKAGGKIVEMMCKKGQKFQSQNASKCRTDRAFVVSITSRDGKETYDKVASDYDSSFVYEVGKEVVAEDYDEKIEECSRGVHFFLSRIAAERY